MDRVKRENRIPIVVWTILCLVAGGMLAGFFGDISAPSAQTSEILPAVPGSFSGLVKATRDSVVNISTVKTISMGGGGRNVPSPFGQDDPLYDMFERFFGGRTPREYQQASLGSGFIIDKDGFILTNNHVVEKTDEIKVKLANEKEYDAEIVGRDPRTDLALIRIETEEALIPLPFGDSEKLEVGDWVLAIGNPFAFGHTVTAGIVSAKFRDPEGNIDYGNFIQTDAPINPGNSGGPLLNTQGKVVGINTAIVSMGGGSVGIGFAIPINMAKDLLPQLRKGKVVRGWLGVMIQEITPELKEIFKLEREEGALVGEVTLGGPADEGGIESGDVIVSFDGEKIQKVDELRYAVAGTPVGNRVAVEDIRDGKKRRLEVKISKLDDETEGGEKPIEEKTDLGMTVNEVTPELARQLDLSEKSGLVVVEVKTESPAGQAGISQGDVILQIDQEPMKDLNTYRRKMNEYKEGDVVLLYVKKRGGPSLYLTLKVGK